MKFETAKNRSDGCDIVAVVLYLGTTLSVRQLKKDLRTNDLSDDSNPLDLADWYEKRLAGNSIEFLRVWQDNISQIQ